MATTQKPKISSAKAKALRKSITKKKVKPVLREAPSVAKLKNVRLKQRFLEGMIQFGAIKKACEHAGISPTLYYYWTDPKWSAGRSTCYYDEDFVHEVALAKEAYRDVLREEARRRGVDGVLKPVFGSLGYREGSGVIGHVTEYSDRLLELLMKMHLPEAKDKPPEDQGGSGLTKLSFDPTQMNQQQRDLLRQLLESFGPDEKTIEGEVVKD